MTSSAARVSQTIVAVNLFASLGIAVFPGPYGDKGSRVRGWPRIDAATARAITLAESRRRDINVVLRTGSELAAIDIDGKYGVDAAVALECLLAILPEGVAVYRSLRGFGILFRPKRVFGDGLLPAYGAELFTAGHLINIPPSRHPSGIDYEWLIAPGDGLPIVDLEALGLLPDDAAATEPKVRRRCTPTPTPEVTQADFERLMASVGISPRRAKQELHRCPWHDDREASLSINWEAAVFNCFAGCGAGGVRELRTLVSLMRVSA